VLCGGEDRQEGSVTVMAGAMPRVAAVSGHDWQVRSGVTLALGRQARRNR